MDVLGFIIYLFFSQNAMNCKYFDSREVCVPIFIAYLYFEKKIF